MSTCPSESCITLCFQKTAWALIFQPLILNLVETFCITRCFPWTFVNLHGEKPAVVLSPSPFSPGSSVCGPVFDAQSFAPFSIFLLLLTSSFTEPRSHRALLSGCAKLPNSNSPHLCFSLLGKIEGRGEEDDRGWDDWMASSTQWTRVEKVPVVGDGWRSLVCYSPWGGKESDTT